MGSPISKWCLTVRTEWPYMIAEPPAGGRKAAVVFMSLFQDSRPALSLFELFLELYNCCLSIL
jgi:hypothetical protein